MDWCTEEGDLPIKLVYDPNAIIDSVRVTAFVACLKRSELAVALPCSCDTQTIMQSAFHAELSNAYAIIMPQCKDWDGGAAGFYGALESIKAGYLYVLDPAFRRRRIDRPQLTVFANTLPDYNLLSEENWDVWKMTPARILVPFKCI
jgi:hypothetical protein